MFMIVTVTIALRKVHVALGVQTVYILNSYYNDVVVSLHNMCMYNVMCH